ncbi:cyclic nucleotide-binding sigma-54-dependent transcriptional regulator, CAP_ED domain-containing [Citrifermentans bemidjiense Bem]|uniref:Cyclic nucleotide-binding sigma-54-dependent transcriptional regulator, CAP_ED domain-containing n=1 Tax=Citrifermentans bemidjiense (strain ATCC BAA-1014 / DSM 16622 / JCM 12645 / Bem) TaxID=404380 RepID=B5EBJ2_CITBB|nr:sigma 54-interacting transcriptional regulator [Citrifermentans bemidjiense]ACH37461.1 cyclic nucleotide-binding sigma-54-dependent transcriptional regulator, CAP_ED domain-containing [Citrifermentans bemidjiense Bem]
MAAISSETISGIRLFSTLNREQLDRIARHLQLREFAPGQIILSRNEPALELYVILAGRIRVELLDEGGQVLTLTELGIGNVIGERAILTDEKRSADVRAITEVQAARLSREDFEELLDQIPALYANLSRIFAAQLGSWAHRHQREESEHREVITNIIGWQLLPEFGQFPGASHWVRLLNQRLQQLGGTRSHVLILGEPGTWKDLAARLIHFHSEADRPVLFLDCASPPPVLEEENEPAEGASQRGVLLGLAQEAALFGHASQGAVYARRVRRGMIELAAGGDMILRNVDCLALAVQEELVDFLDTGHFTRRGETKLRSARVRIIATSGKALEPLIDSGKFNGELYRKLCGETVELAPLRERKKDIPVIAKSLLASLNAKHNRNVRRLSQDALNRLVDHDWPLNATELYQVVSRAVVVCSDTEIQPEHISLQGHPFEDGRFNLLTLPSLERLAWNPRFPKVLRWLTVPAFLLITLYTLLGPASDNAANLAAWTLGWPALILTAFLFARGWCSFCPMEAIGERLGVTSRVVRDPAPWLRSFGPSLSFAALVLILLMEQATGMFSHAAATGLLLSGMLTATVSADLVIGRRGWCKFLCPLGRIVSLVSRISPLEMHSNHNVCLSRCRVDDCIKEKACPMGLHPSGVDSSDHCVLCLNCVRNCPHHSMQLDLRNPTCGVFNKARRGFREAFFSVTLLGAVIAAKGTPLLAGRQPELFPRTLWTLEDYLLALCLVAGFTFLALIASVAVRGARWRSVFTSSGLAYLPLAAAGLFLIFFRPLVEGGARLVPLAVSALGAENFLDATALTPELGTLRLLIYPIILLAALFSWVVLARLQRLDGLPPAALLRHRLLILGATAILIKIL